MRVFGAEPGLPTPDPLVADEEFTFIGLKATLCGSPPEIGVPPWFPAPYLI